MNILEQILEKIEHEAMTNKEIGRKQCEGMARAMNIIRSYIDDVTVEDIHSKCSECSRRKWYQKGYEDGKKDICNDNDWIPVEERLPEESGHYLVQLSRKIPYENFADRVVMLYDGEEKAFLDYESLIIAWRPLPEPYKPKKVTAGMEHIMSRFMKAW